MISKQVLLKTQVLNFFEKKENLAILLECINSSTPVSLRLIDWFVTNYCKYNSNKIASDLGIDIYNSYKGQLKSYNKIFFDPFCRNTRKKYKKDLLVQLETVINNEKKMLNTSLGQLNFFRWVININIIPYLNKNLIFLKQQSKQKTKIKTTVIKEKELVEEKIFYYSVSF